MFSRWSHRFVLQFLEAVAGHTTDAGVTALSVVHTKSCEVAAALWCGREPFLVFWLSCYRIYIGSGAPDSRREYPGSYLGAKLTV